MNISNIRRILFHIDDGEITVKELRAALFEIEDQNTHIDYNQMKDIIVKAVEEHTQQ